MGSKIYLLALEATIVKKIIRRFFISGYDLWHKHGVIFLCNCLNFLFVYAPGPAEPSVCRFKAWIICFCVWFQPFWSLKFSTLLKLEISSFRRVEISRFRRVEISKQTNAKADDSNFKFSDFFFFQNWKTQFWKQIVIYVVAFDPIKIQTCLAPQNDCQNQSFVKDNYVVGKKMTRYGPKNPNW